MHPSLVRRMSCRIVSRSRRSRQSDLLLDLRNGVVGSDDDLAWWTKDEAYVIPYGISDRDESGFASICGTLRWTRRILNGRPVATGVPADAVQP